jgi:divalent metal cation (Fe/Co/Zn/Cd) transporter
MAKIFLRGINFACSLIVLSMIATAFSIFRATKTLAPRNGLPPWAEGTQVWPQILLLVIAAISLAMSVIVICAYWRSGHNRAEKVAAYYTVFAVGFFIFSIVMWAIGAAVFNQSKAQNNNKDMWGWSCVDNKRRHLFEDDIAYGLVCRLQVSSKIESFSKLGY